MPKPTKPKKDTHRYKGWLNSDSFWKRAFAILGYSTLASLVLWIALAVFGLFVAEVVIFFFDPEVPTEEVGQIEEY